MAAAPAMRAALGLVALALACRGKQAPPPPPPPAPLAGCIAALGEAATLPPAQRTAAVLRGCPVCGPSLAPLLAAADGHPDLVAMNALIDACQTGCRKAALGTWRSQLSDLEPGPGVARPWKSLAAECPATMHAPKPSERFVGAAWWGLVTIGQRLVDAAPALPADQAAALTAARAALVIALPPWTVTGNGLVAPSGVARAGLPWRHVTVTDQALLIGRLPFGRFTDAGFVVDAGPTPYPGQPLTGDPAAALAALAPPPGLRDAVDLPVVIAPIAAPATRLIAALRALGPQPVALAVALPDAPGGWRGSIAAHALAIAPATGARVRLDVAAARLAVVAGDGTVLASAPWPDAATPRARQQAALALAAGHAVELAPALPAALEVADVAALCDDAHAAGATGLALAPDGADAAAAPLPSFDLAALRAALAKAAQP